MHASRIVFRAVKRVLTAVLLLLIGLALVPLWLPIVVFDYARWSHRHRRFVRAHHSQVFLVWHARRGWYDFVRNNVLPVLPADVLAIQDRRHGGDDLAVIRRVAVRCGRLNPSHPYLAAIGRKRVHVASLNTVLQSTKMRMRRDVSVQAEIRRVLEYEAARCAACVH